MKENKSLEISTKIQVAIREGLLGPILKVFPSNVIEKYSQEKSKRRNRVYTLENTILSMVMAATAEDKTLQRSVMTFKQIFEHKVAEEVKRQEDENKKAEEAIRANTGKVKRGRPRKIVVSLSKSKQKELSLNTASYTEARQRLPRQVMEDVFEETKTMLKRGKLWHGREVYIADGTYVQMQDSSELREKYGCKIKKNTEERGYPQGLLQCMVHQESGCIDQYDLANRSCSELDLIFKQLKKLPKKSLVLADALYECRAVFQAVKHLGLDIIVPLKRKQNATVLRSIADGDDIIKIQMTDVSAKRLRENGFSAIPKTLTMRRITYSDSQNPSKKHILLTSILDELIPAVAIIGKYHTRWDIEISIREIKTIMHLNVLRSKSEDMIFKELAAAMIAYNLIRRIIAESIKDSDFPPKEDLFFSFYSIGKDLLIDKKGRLYQRWSPGRYGAAQKSDPIPTHAFSNLKFKLFQRSLGFGLQIILYGPSC